MISRTSFGRAAGVVIAAALVAAPLAACVRPAPHRDHTLRTRTLAWPGGSRLFAGADADVRYVQGSDAKVVVTGPAYKIDDIAVDDGVIHYDRRHWRWGWWSWWPDRREDQVHIVVTAPPITDAGVGSSGHLDLGRLSQDRLNLLISGSGAIEASGQFKSLSVSVSGSGAVRLSQVDAGDMTADISGSGWIKASGAANTLHLSISGSGFGDLAELSVQDADAHLFGSGMAKISPKRSADISVAGSGSVQLLNRPPQLSTHRSGSGSIGLPDGAG